MPSQLSSVEGEVSEMVIIIDTLISLFGPKIDFLLCELSEKFRAFMFLPHN